MPSASWLPRRSIAASFIRGWKPRRKTGSTRKTGSLTGCKTLPPQTGIIAVTDARARHVLQACELLHIPVPEKLCVIGIDNEELTRYLSRVALSLCRSGHPPDGLSGGKATPPAVE